MNVNGECSIQSLIVSAVIQAERESVQATHLFLSKQDYDELLKELGVGGGLTLFIYSGLRVVAGDAAREYGLEPPMQGVVKAARVTKPHSRIDPDAYVGLLEELVDAVGVAIEAGDVFQDYTRNYLRGLVEQIREAKTNEEAKE